MCEYFRSISAVIFILINWRVGLWEQILFWIEESHWKKSWQWPDKSQSCPAWSIPTICFSSSSRFIAPSWVKIKNNPNHLFLFQVKLKCTCSYKRILSHLLSMRKGALWNWKWFLPVSIHTWQIVFWLWIENTRGRRYGFHEKNPNQIFLKSKQTFCDNKNV